MAQFIEVRTARKDHPPETSTGGCESCLGPIKTGEQYARCTATPDDPDIVTDRWSHMKVHWPYETCPASRKLSQ